MTMRTQDPPRFALPMMLVGLAFLFSAGLSAVDSPAEAAGEEPPPAEEEEVIFEDLEAQLALERIPFPSGCETRSSDVFDVTCPMTLTNNTANKLVVGPKNKLHLVYQDEDQIWYQISADGLNWTTPVLVSGSDTSVGFPAIAVTADSRAIFVWNQTVPNPPIGTKDIIRYTVYDLVSGMWDPTVTVVDYDGKRPSMDIHNGDVHLIWIYGEEVQYTTFDAATPPTPAINIETVDYIIPTCSHSYEMASIAVADNAGNPEVLVATYFLIDVRFVNPPCNQSSTVQIRFDVWERIGAGTFVNVISQTHAQNWPSWYEMLSISMDAGPNGDFFIADSFGLDPQRETRVRHLRKNGSWSHNSVLLLSNAKTLIDIAVDPNDGDHYKVAYSDTGLGSHKTTMIYDGRLPVSGAHVPGNLKWLSFHGNQPQAVFHEYCQGSRMCRLDSVWEEEVISDYHLRSDVECCFEICSIGNDDDGGGAGTE